MKIKYLILLVVLMVVLVIGKSCDINFSRSYHHRFTKTTDLSMENVNGIHLGDRIDDKDVEEEYGKISDLSRDNIMHDYYFLSKMIEVVTEKNDKEIIRFVVNDKDIETSKGIKIGDSREKVIDTYGENYYYRLEQGTDIIGYVDKDMKISIEFWLDHNGRLVFYRLDYNFME